MGERNNIRMVRQHHNRRKKWLGRTILLSLLVGIGVGIYVIAQQLWGVSAVSASSKDQPLVVTEVAAFATAAQEKKAPTMFNGVKRKVAYLTFDDGPNKYTPEILQILKENDAKATFFLLGNSMQQYPEYVKQIAADGHYLALHSMTHDYSKLYKSGSADNFVGEFREAQKMVEDLTGVKTSLIRAPYGSAPQIKEPFRADIAEAGFKMWDWTLDTNDWKYAKNPMGMLDEVKRGLTEDTEIILMHDRKQTVQALPAIIEYITSQGYEFEVYDPSAHIVVNFHHDDRL